MVDLDQGGAHAHAIIRAPIPGDLAEVVSALTLHEGGGPDWKIVADDAPHLVFSISSSRGEPLARERCRLVLVGARSHAAVGDHRTRRLTALVRFWPGGIPAVFGIPGSEMTDQSLDLSDLMVPRPDPDRLAALASRSHASLLQGMLDVVRDAHRRTKGRAIDWRVRALLAGDPEGGQISRTASRSGVSVRTLRRVVGRPRPPTA